MSSILTGLNNWAFHIVLYFANPALNSFMSLMGTSFLVVLPLLALYLYLKKDKNVFSFVFGMVLIFLITEIIKDIIKEPRPCSVADLQWINHVGCEASYSFPSNHATVLTGLLFFLNKYNYVRALYGIWVILILVGRVYLGAHYLTDVIAGIVISIIFYYIILSRKDKINSFFAKILARIAKPLCPDEFLR
ncbi:phosphatase PAP2 family protein [Candidatus Marsarchaeota archaeon]|nr:phosphatase PAP2 family protein [Candidatus Marsarchaeota archaeon]